MTKRLCGFETDQEMGLFFTKDAAEYATLTYRVGSENLDESVRAYAKGMKAYLAASEGAFCYVFDIRNLPIVPDWNGLQRFLRFHRKTGEAGVYRKRLVGTVIVLSSESHAALLNNMLKMLYQPTRPLHITGDPSCAASFFKKVWQDPQIKKDMDAGVASVDQRSSDIAGSGAHISIDQKQLDDIVRTVEASSCDGTGHDPDSP